MLRLFLGNVARRLVREARCSVMLFTKPAREPQPLRSFVFFVSDFSEHAQRALETLRLAEQEQCENLYAIRVYTSFDAARAMLRANHREGEFPPRRAPGRRGGGLGRFHRPGRRDAPSDRSAVHPGEHGFRCFRTSVQAVQADLLVVPVEARSTSDGCPRTSPG